jgi:hypothetical protein
MTLIKYGFVRVLNAGPLFFAHYNRMEKFYHRK